MSNSLSTFNPFLSTSLPTAASLPSTLTSSLKTLTTKKDTVTRTKALVTVSQTIQDLSLEQYETLWHIFPNVYSKCIVTGSRPVREKAQSILVDLLRLHKTGLESHLKDICGPWFSSWFDPVQSVQKKALEAVDVSFKFEKQVKAAKYCKDACVAWIQQWVGKQAPEKNNEEEEEIYSRNYACSMYLLAWMLENDISVPIDEEMLKKGFQTDVTFQVKAMCKLVLVMGTNADVIVPKLIEIAVETPLGCEETVWQVLTVITRANAMIWKIPVPKKPLVNRLYSFLEKGALGKGRIVYPFLLPLFHAWKEKEIDVSNGLKSLWKGIANVDVLVVPLLLTTFEECLKLIENSSSLVALPVLFYVKQFIDNKHFPVISLDQINQFIQSQSDAWIDPVLDLYDNKNIIVAEHVISVIPWCPRVKAISITEPIDLLWCEKFRDKCDNESIILSRNVLEAPHKHDPLILSVACILVNDVSFVSSLSFEWNVVEEMIKKRHQVIPMINVDLYSLINKGIKVDDRLIEHHLKDLVAKCQDRLTQSFDISENIFKCLNKHLIDLLPMALEYRGIEHVLEQCPFNKAIELNIDVLINKSLYKHLELNVLVSLTEHYLKNMKLSLHSPLPLYYPWFMADQLPVDESSHSFQWMNVLEYIATRRSLSCLLGGTCMMANVLQVIENHGIGISDILLDAIQFDDELLCFLSAQPLGILSIFMYCDEFDSSCNNYWLQVKRDAQFREKSINEMIIEGKLDNLLDLNTLLFMDYQDPLEEICLEYLPCAQVKLMSTTDFKHEMFLLMASHECPNNLNQLIQDATCIDKLVLMSLVWLSKREYLSVCDPSKWINALSKNDLKEYPRKVFEACVFFTGSHYPPLYLITPPTVCCIVNWLRELKIESFIPTAELISFMNTAAEQDDFSCLMSWLVYCNYLARLNDNEKLECLAWMRDERITWLGRVMETICIHVQSFDVSKWDIESLEISVHIQCTDLWLKLISCHVLWRLLLLIPMNVRLWWNECPRRQFTTALESFVERYYSKELIRKELLVIHRYNGDNSKENVSFRPCWTVPAQVIATYTIDQVSMEIILTLPRQFPLRQVVVQGGRRAGVSEGKWRHWLLATSSAMNHHQSSLLEGLLLWESNADKRFQGIEDCPICYCVIHITDRSLPSQICKTCKHKFHGACLFKWFKSSNQSSCPLCRSLF